jgi:hypothetical protein
VDWGERFLIVRRHCAILRDQHDRFTLLCAISAIASPVTPKDGRRRSETTEEPPKSEDAAMVEKSE